MSDSSRVQVRYVAESSWGVTPSSALKNLRTTGFRLKRATQGQVSQEIRSDGQIPDWVRTGANVEGEIPFELIYGNLDTLLEGVYRGSWATDTGFSGASVGTDLLQNGTTAKSFTLEAEHSDITVFHSFTGCRANMLSLSIRPGQIITGSMGFLGKLDALSGSTVGTGAATAAVTNDPMNAVTHLSGVLEGGSTTELLGIELQINNGLRVQPQLASISPSGIGYGRFNVTGTIEAYFSSVTLLNKYLNQTASSLGFTLTDAQGNAYEFKIDSLKYTDGDKPVDGNDQDIVVKLPFQGRMDATTGKTLRMTRNPVG